MKIDLKGGGSIYIRTEKEAHDFIQELRRGAMNKEADLKKYMVAVSRRCYETNNSNIRTKSYKWFLHDLIKNGFAKIDNQKISWINSN